MAVSRKGVNAAAAADTECPRMRADNHRSEDTTSAFNRHSGVEGGEISTQFRVSVRGGQACVAVDQREPGVLNFTPQNSAATNTGLPRKDLASDFLIGTVRSGRSDRSDAAGLHSQQPGQRQHHCFHWLIPEIRLPRHLAEAWAFAPGVFAPFVHARFSRLN